MTLSCLFCSHPIHVNNRMKPGDELSCSKCKTVFRLVSTSPFSIDWLQIKERNSIIPDDEETSFELLN